MSCKPERHEWKINDEESHPAQGASCLCGGMRFYLSTGKVNTPPAVPPSPETKEPACGSWRKMTQEEARIEARALLEYADGRFMGSPPLCRVGSGSLYLERLRAAEAHEILMRGLRRVLHSPGCTTSK